MKARLQNKIAGSEFTLPVCVVAATGMWWLPQREFSLQHLSGLAACLLATYIMMETNAREHIIRIRTRLMSCVWLMLAACLSFMHPLGEPAVAAVLLCLSYLLLFRCYQRHHPQIDVFHAFLMLSVGSFFAPVMLLMSVPYFLYLAIFLRSLTRKAFCAGIIGLAVPYWCYAVWCFVVSDMSSFPVPFEDLRIEHFQSLDAFAAHWLPLAEGTGRVAQISAAVVALLSVVSILHYLRTNYDDKIRVRMYLYIYVSQTLLLMLYLGLRPESYETTMALLVCSAAPLISHYFALSKTLLTMLFFCLSLLLVAGMAALNLCPALVGMLPF